MAKRSQEKQNEARERLTRLYENLGKLYSVSLARLRGTYLKVARAMELMCEEGANSSKYYKQLAKREEEINTLIKDGENALEINNAEVKAISNGEPLKGFDYKGANDIAENFKRTVDLTCDKATKTLNSSNAYRQNLISSKSATNEKRANA